MCQSGEICSSVTSDHFGREPEWRQWSLVTDEQISPDWHMWEGASCEAYDNGWEKDKTAFHVFSNQVEMMNHVFMKEMAWQVNPAFFYENIFWTGGSGKAEVYEKQGLVYTPRRFAAWAQYVMWTLTPRIVRQWNGSQDEPEGWWNDYMALVRAVDLVHADPVLTRFWRHGKLVVNPEDGHPFNHNIPDPWQGKERWFHLNCSTDPARPWTLTTRLPVLSLARVIGEAPEREWLLYAHATMLGQSDVTVRIPGYQAITVDVPVEGAFWHLREADGSVVPVGDTGQLRYPHNTAPSPRADTYRIAVNEPLETSIFRFSGVPGLLANDSDIDGDILSAALADPPAKGALELQSNGSFKYTPPEGFIGTVSFSYTVADYMSRSAPTEVAIQVVPGLSQVIDDGDEGFVDETAFTHNQGDGYDGDFAYIAADPALRGGSTVTCAFQDLPPGEYEVALTWPIFSFNRPQAVPYTMNADGKEYPPVMVSQQDPPEGPVVDGVPWQILGRYDVQQGHLEVTMSNAADGRWVVADAVRLRHLETGTIHTIDNGDQGYSENAHWIPEEIGFGGDCRHVRGEKRAVETADKAMWTFTGIEPGAYRIYATWPAGDDRGNVTYHIMDGDEPAAEVVKDQSEVPHDLVARGTPWSHLADVEITGNRIVIRLGNARNRHKPNVTADAVGLAPANGGRHAELP
jgi:hypothetical protein